MYAYTDGATFIDNSYEYYELLQIENSTDALSAAGYGMEYHVGATEVFASLNGQVGLWTLSTHGTLTLLPRDPPDRPDGLGHFSLRSADAQWGFEVSEAVRESPEDGDSLVNPVVFQTELQYHVTRSTNDLESNIGNIGSPIVILTACLLGGTGMPLMLMEHGAVAVTASPRTVYFQPAGMLSVLLAQGLSSGGTIGAALAEGHSLISSDYSDPLTGRDPRDYANQQVLYGDPSVRLYDPNAPRVISLDPLSASFGGHTPGLGIKPVAALGSTDYLPVSLTTLGIQHDYYTASNFSEFMILLSMRSVTIVEPEVIGSFSSNLTQNSAEISDYVRSGGILAVLGTEGDHSWLPWPVEYNAIGSGSSVSFADDGHPLLTLPNEMNTTLDYAGYFTSIWSNFTILATDGSHPVFIAGQAGNGKIALTTINPNGASREDMIENIVNWADVPSIQLRRATLSQIIIWSGDTVVISLELTDAVGNPVVSAAVSVWLNASEQTVEEVSGGLYRVALTGEWTNVNIGDFDLQILARSSGYDTLSATLTSFMTVRPFPLLTLAVFGGGIAVAAIGYLYIKRRRNGGSLRQDSSMTKREREQQRKEDSKVDAKEYFGV